MAKPVVLLVGADAAGLASRLEASGYHPTVEAHPNQGPDAVLISSSHMGSIAELRAQLWAELKASGDLRALGRGAEYEAYPSADVRRRGFYEKYLRGEKLDANWVIPSDWEPAPLK